MRFARTSLALVGVILVAACGGSAGGTASPTEPVVSTGLDPVPAGSTDPGSTDPGSATEDSGGSGQPGAPSTLPLYVAPSAPTEEPAADIVLPAPVEVDEPTALPVTVTSADGTEVTISDNSRIVPLWGNLSEIVFGLGLGDHVVARDVSATFVEAAGLPIVTRGHQVSAEGVLSLRPTVVLAQTDTGPAEALDQIRAAGVPILVLDTPTNVADSTERITQVATALGVPQAGAALAARTDEAIAAALAAVPEGTRSPRVAFLYMRGSAGVYLMGGPGSGADSMIVAAGGIDAGTEMGLDQAFTPLTSEALAAAQPDAILMTTTGLASVGGLDGLVEVPGIAQTPAGKDRRVITVEDGLLYSFGARTPDAIAEIVRQLYPET